MDTWLLSNPPDCLQIPCHTRPMIHPMSYRTKPVFCPHPWRAAEVIHCVWHPPRSNLMEAIKAIKGYQYQGSLGYLQPCIKIGRTKPKRAIQTLFYKARDTQKVSAQEHLLWPAGQGGQVSHLYKNAVQNWGYTFLCLLRFSGHPN